MPSADPARPVTTSIDSKTEAAPQRAPASQTSLVWDWPLRVVHWLLFLSLAGSWITAEAGYDYTKWHFRLGYLALGLVLFRILWGLAGTHHARFASFLTVPWRALGYLPALLRRDSVPPVGHSPAGGWASLILLTLVATQAGTGLFISDDIFWAGPYNGAVSSDLAGTLAGVHHLNFNFLQGMVVLHVVVIGWYRWGRGVNLVTPMVTGRKDLPAALAGQGIESSLSLRALLLAAVSAAAIYVLLAMAPPPAPSDYIF